MPPRLAAPCRHRGRQIIQGLPIYACPQYGRCTPQPRPDLAVICCEGCPEYQPARQLNDHATPPADPPAQKTRRLAVPGQQPAPQIGPVDVLVLDMQATPAELHHARRTVGDLQAAGYRATYAAAPRTVRDCQALLDGCRPRLVINRAFHLLPEILEHVAPQWPRVKFLTVNHSAPSHLLVHQSLLKRHNRFASLARRLPNCYLGTPDCTNPWLLAYRHPRCVWVPNTLPPAPLDDAPLGRPPVVSLCGRGDMVKNWVTQAVALMVAHRACPLQVMVCIRGPLAEDVEAMLTAGSVPVTRSRWTSHEHWLASLRTIDVGLQVSFAESFNYVAAEHLIHGRPVIGSPAIRFLPPAWKAEPTDPHDIADKLLHLLRTWDASTRQQAHGIARELSDLNAAGWQDLIGRLLGSAAGSVAAPRG